MVYKIPKLPEFSLLPGTPTWIITALKLSLESSPVQLLCPAPKQGL
jgi:hypothetical protein